MLCQDDAADDDNNNNKQQHAVAAASSAEPSLIHHMRCELFLLNEYRYTNIEVYLVQPYIFIAM